MAWRGWLALSVSTLSACFWAYWGTNEAFHEGWWKPTLAGRLLQTLAYLGPMLGTLLLSAAAVRWPTAGAAVMALLAAAILVWGYRQAPNLAAASTWLVLAGPLLAVAALYAWGRPEPLAWAWRVLWGLPLLVVLACGCEPVWRVAHRVDDGDRGERRVTGHGVTLRWAPAGPGWVRSARDACTWDEAVRRCAHLSADGSRLLDEPPGLWRLPTVDELVRSMTRGGHNAGGVWDPSRRQAHYRAWPDRESPLWDAHAETIYWWTASELDPTTVWRVTATGRVFPLRKQLAMGSVGFRAVRVTERVATVQP